MLMGLQFRRMIKGIEPWQLWMWQPQIGKSEIVCRKGPIWAHDWDPTENIIVASYAVSLAAKSTRYVRNTYRDRTDVLRVRLDPSATAQTNFRTTEGGSVLGVGVGGSVTGEPGTVLLADDLHKNWFEAHQQAARDKVWDWLKGDAYERLSDNARGILCATRWHPDDVHGRSLEEGLTPSGDPWTVVHVPAIADSQVVSPDLLGRQDGEVVEPKRFRRSTMVNRRKLAGEFIWNAEYQGNPRVAEGGIFRRSWFEERPAMIGRTQALDFITSWDCTFSDSGQSYVVGQAWALTPDKPHRFLIYDSVRGKWDLPSTRDHFLAFARRHPECRAHLIERAANGPGLAAELEREHGVSGIQLITPDLGKVARAIRVTPLVADSRVEVAGWVDPTEWVDSFLTELTDFDNGANDDQVDACTQALHWLDLLAHQRYGREAVVIDERLFGRR
jgi:predicted phage terminase large subunit-like protein